MSITFTQSAPGSTLWVFAHDRQYTARVSDSQSTSSAIPQKCFAYGLFSLNIPLVSSQRKRSLISRYLSQWEIVNSKIFLERKRKSLSVIIKCTVTYIRFAFMFDSFVLCYCYSLSLCSKCSCLLKCDISCWNDCLVCMFVLGPRTILLILETKRLIRSFISDVLNICCDLAHPQEWKTELRKL